MRERDFILLAVEAARNEVQGGDSGQLLADGLHRILDVGVGIGRWPVGSPAMGRLFTAGVPAISSAEFRNVIRYAPLHPRVQPAKLRSARPFRLSDDLDLVRFWDTDIWWYNHGIRDGRYPAGFSLGIHDGQAGLVGLHRGKRDFTAEELAYLDLMREPLQSALRFRGELDQAVRRLNLGTSVQDDEDRRLTSRERDVLALVTTGRTNAVIGTILGITERTVRKHLTNIYAKLEVSGRTAAAMWFQNSADAPKFDPPGGEPSGAELSG
jgi:DNA-binding CsgD family transcriptional regulator